MVQRVQECWRSILLFGIYLLLVVGFTKLIYMISVECHNCENVLPLTLSGSGYGDAHFGTIQEQLIHRIRVQPFNLLALIIFICAIIHTFLAPKFHAIAERMYQKNVMQQLPIADTFGVEMMRFMGEVEVIFGLWVVPLLIAMALSYNWVTALDYLSQRDYTEPMFVVVVMALASSRPLVNLAEECLKWVARLGGESVQAWWLCILSIGPLVGSLITEPGAMTIAALLLGKQFYFLQPSRKLAYATLGLLFVNVSVGGVFTSFAAPPVLMVSKVWGWDTAYMFSTFGLKAALGVFVSNALYFFVFRKEFKDLEQKRQALKNEEAQIAATEPLIPVWVTFAHLIFLAWIVVHGHFPAMFIGSFLLFIGFHRATLPYQNRLALKAPILVGFFLAGLVVHGSLQAWWIAPVLSGASEGALMVMSTILTAFNDNAEITFLASLIPSFSGSMKYAVMAGAVTGGGLTVIANAPNPLGQSLLAQFFPEGIRPWNLFLAALAPTLIVGAIFWFLRAVP